MDELVKMRDVFRDSADILDKLIKLQDEEETEDIREEYESLMGRFAFKMMELQNLQG